MTDNATTTSDAGASGPERTPLTSSMTSSLTDTIGATAAVFVTGPSADDRQVSAVQAAAQLLELEGHQAYLASQFLPAALYAGADRTRMGSDATAIGTVDAVAVLIGWENDPTARAHVAIARALDLPILDALTGLVIDTDAAPSAAPNAAGGVHPNTGVGPGETRVTSATGGAKGQKEARFDLIPPGPLKELAVLYDRGATKYDETNEDANWKRGYPWSLSYAALMRHLQLWWSREEDHDLEMGVKHLTNVAWHAFNLMWFMENRTEFDDRPQGSKNPDGTMTGEVYVGARPAPAWIGEKIARKAAEAAAEAASSPAVGAPR